MKVSELIKKLKTLDDNLDIFIYNSERDYMSNINDVRELTKEESKYYASSKEAVKIC